MVAKIVSGKSIRGILTYSEQKVEKGEAKVLMASGFATEIDRLNFYQKLFRFEALTNLNSRSKVNAMHISLNFHADDKLDVGTIQQIASEYMERIGLGEQPFIAYEHFDAAHPHLHIATVLIDREGQRLSTNNIGKERSEPARVLLEEKFGLVKAQGRKLGIDPYLKPAVYGERPTKKQLASITKLVMRDYAYTSFTEYKAVLTQFNVNVDRGIENSVMFEKQGLVYSVMDPDGRLVGVPFKASAFYEGATMKRIERNFNKNKDRKLGLRQELKNRIDGILGRFDTVSKQTLLKALAGEQIALVFRQNENGLIYGVTFIDHKNKVVFNGSDLGKGYSAKAIMERLSVKDEIKQFLAKGQNKNTVGDELEIADGHNRDRENLLDGLLAKADYDDPTVIGKRRKKKPGQEQSRECSF